MKKILILTVTAGEGHNSIAKALNLKLKQNPDYEVKVIDLFKKYASSLKVKFINDGYIAACKYAMPIYNMIFNILRSVDPSNRNKIAVHGTIINETTKLLQDIYFYQPDVILCTHFYASTIISNLRKVYPMPAKTAVILSDFTVHPFWEASIGVDYMITPTEDLHETLIYKGYKPEQLLPYGIPVREEFSQYKNKIEARRELGLDENMFTALVMFGGGGFGENIKVFKKLMKVKTPMQILFVNGKDQASKKKIDNMIEKLNPIHKIFNYGFVDFIPTAMSASDVLIGKCGGVSSNESLNKRLPLVLSTNLAQQEKDNMLFLVSKGAALNYNSKRPLEKLMTEIVNNPECLDKIKENIDNVRKPNALKDICDLVDSFEKVEYSEVADMSQKALAKIRSEIRKILRKKEEEKQKRQKQQKDSVSKSKEVI